MRVDIPTQRLLRVNDAARYAGIGRTSLYKLIRDGDLTLVKLAGRSLVDRGELDRVIDAQLEDAG